MVAPRIEPILPLRCYPNARPTAARSGHFDISELYISITGIFQNLKCNHDL